MSERIRINAGKRDKTILSEMIGMVDKDKMQTIMSVAASHSNGSKKNQVSMDIVNHYLEEWAEAKYDYFVMFGHQLCAKKEIEFDMSREEMDSRIDMLCMQYPQYALLLKMFDTNSYLANRYSGFAVSPKTDLEKSVYDMYNILYCDSKKKVSTILSEIIQDKGYPVERVLGDGTVVTSLHTFDIELSKVMQTKKIKGNIVVSINPLDYLMMSTNKHGWKSCMAMSPSCYGYNNITLSKMVDEATLVGYKCSNDIHKYSLEGFEFEYHSMQARYLLFCDKDTGACGIDHGYGGDNCTLKLKESILALLMDSIKDYSEIKSDWVKTKTFDVQSLALSYNEGVDICYINKCMGQTHQKAHFKTGVGEIVCPNCGRKITNRDNFICCNSQRG